MKMKNTDKTYVTSNTPQWNYPPLDAAPPLGKKIHILSAGDISIQGHWDPKANHKAWAPLMKRDLGKEFLVQAIEDRKEDTRFLHFAQSLSYARSRLWLDSQNFAACIELYDLLTSLPLTDFSNDYIIDFHPDDYTSCNYSNSIRIRYATKDTLLICLIGANKDEALSLKEILEIKDPSINTRGTSWWLPSYDGRGARATTYTIFQMAHKRAKQRIQQDTGETQNV